MIEGEKNEYYQNEYKIVTKIFFAYVNNVECACYMFVSDVQFCEYICVFDKYSFNKQTHT